MPASFTPTGWEQMYTRSLQIRFSCFVKLLVEYPHAHEHEHAVDDDHDRQ